MTLAFRSVPAVSLVLLLAIAWYDGSRSSGNEPPVIEEILADPATPTPSWRVDLSVVATDPETVVIEVRQDD